MSKNVERINFGRNPNPTFAKNTDLIRSLQTSTDIYLPVEEIPILEDGILLKKYIYYGNSQIPAVSEKMNSI